MFNLVTPNTHHQLQVAAQEHGMRLDVFITSHFPSYSRSFFQKLIEAKHIHVNGHKVVKQGMPLKVNDLVSIFFPAEPKRSYIILEQPVDVRVLYEHEHFLVLYKPAGFNVHAPSSNHTEPSLVDWLLAHYEQIATVGYNDRPGIVHRLDKDTSGIILVARTNYAHAYLADQFRRRTVQKTYWALVQGHPSKEGTIDLAIARHPTDKKRMTHVNPQDYRLSTLNEQGPIVVSGLGKVRHALSTYKVLAYFDNNSWIEVKPHTGRTHQIRVHCAAIGHPLMGDALYGRKSAHIARHALHAYALSFTFEEKKYDFSVEAPQDFKDLLSTFKISAH